MKSATHSCVVGQFPSEKSKEFCKTVAAQGQAMVRGDSQDVIFNQDLCQNLPFNTMAWDF